MRRANAYASLPIYSRQGPYPRNPERSPNAVKAAPLLKKPQSLGQPQTQGHQETINSPSSMLETLIINFVSISKSKHAFIMGVWGCQAQFRGASKVTRP